MPFSLYNIPASQKGLRVITERGISCTLTRPWSARNADKNSLSLPASRNFMPRRASPTSPSAARNAAQSVKTLPTTAHARCSTLSAQSAESPARFPSSRAPTVPYTAATASEINSSSDPIRSIRRGLPTGSPLRFCLFKFTFSTLTLYYQCDIIKNSLSAKRLFLSGRETVFMKNQLKKQHRQWIAFVLALLAALTVLASCKKDQK